MTMVYIACMEYGEEVAGVFSTLEKAIEVIDRLGPETTNGRENCFVESRVLDQELGAYGVTTGYLLNDST